MSIELRRIQESDTGNILRWRNSKSVMENFVMRTPLTEEDHRRWLVNKIEQGLAVQFIIVDTNGPVDIGTVYIRDIDAAHRKGEFGIFIGEESARGKGCGKKATALILEYGFTELNLNRIYLRVFPDNAAAIRSYEKCGFRQEGYFRQDVLIGGTPRDMIYMGITKADWEKKNG